MTKVNNKNSTAKQPQLESDEQISSRMQEIPIAIVGISSIFANAKNLDQYWDNILDSVDCIMDVPPSRWNIDDYYDDDIRAADKVYCKRGGFIPDIDFNPMEFGLPPNILEITDVAQLLSLVVAKDVLEDAGMGEGSGKSRERVGITLGVGGGQKLIAPLTSRLQGPVLDRVLKSSGVPDKDRTIIIEKFKSAYVPWEENSFPGMLGNVIAGRVANRFDLGGMNCVVDAACAGSLAAMKMAVSDLLEGRSDAMITGGVCCDNSPFMFMSFSKTPAFTTNQTIQPFDHDSKGMMVGEGLGMVVLKRLVDAERDGDRIYAQIKGVGTSSDGRFKSIYAPRPEGQELALKRAYKDAGIDMSTVGIIEAHGTGTAAGDLAEFNGLRSAFGRNNDQKNHIALGSVKSQIGHAKSAAGAAGLIKMALALHHKVLPGTINVEKPNPALNVDDSPFYINSETRPWMPREDGAPRVAGVSSFGFGGTNFHFVLQEYTTHQDGKFRVSQAPQAVILSGTDVGAVKAACSAWLDKVSGDDAEVQQQQLTMNNGFRPIPADQARLGFVSKSAEETKSLLEKAMATFDKKAADTAWELPMGVFYRSSGLDAKGKVVALFSGQGSQYVNMGHELASNFPPVMNAMEDLDKLYAVEGKPLLSQHIYPTPVFDKAAAKVLETELQKTQNAQPSIGVVGVGLFKLMQNAGLKANYTAGHSFGELTALWAAGVLNEADYFALAKARGEAMAAPDDASFDAGTMVAVVGDPDKVAVDISGNSDVTIANYNSNNQVVIAGATDAINKAFDDLKAKGYKVVKLPVSAAFHTPLVGHAQKPFADAISKATFNSPSIPVYANGTGLPHSNNADEIKAVMKNHILESVRFKDEIENIHNDGGRIFVEFGPKNVLSKLVGNILADKDFVAVALNGNPKKSSDLQFRQAAVQLAVAGVELGAVDPYEIDRVDLSAIKKSPMNVKLNAGLYMSDKTRKAHEEKLNDGHKIAGLAAPIPAPTPVAPTAPAPVAAVPAPAPAPATATADAKSLAILESIEKSIAQFNVRQSETLDVHQKFMEGPKQYTETFQNLLQQQTALLQSSGSLPESLERSMMLFHEFQGETLRVHESYLNSQMSELNHVIEGVTEQYRALATGNVVAKKIVPAVVAQAQAAAPAPVAPAVVTPSATPAAEPEAVAPAVDVEKVNKVMMDVVAEKTGYPAEMLELGMDMEADLGIDSIKRVEILGAVQDELPDLPELNPDDLAELRTLGQIVDYMNAKAGASAPAVAPVAVAVPEVAVPAVDVEKINKVMMDVVAEKTGYPAEMLELGMDMEADLGIDSIKRVEILGAVQDELPDLPELNPDDLAELRTLGQIVDYMNAKAGASAPAVAPVVAAPAVAAPAVDVEKINKVMMDVVAEKTGYPAEMLELGMDMEADLGIDSIKRVEILGAVQDELPDLPELNPDDLAELRTLGQIVDYMNEQAGSSAPALTAAPAVTPAVVSAPAANASVDVEKINTVMMAVVADKTGYPPELLDMTMDMEADLGIDSIKRVEILGAVQDELPDLPELNPDDLAELRTLGEIVDYMNSKAGSSASPAVVAPVSATTAVAPTASTIDVAKITDVMMAVVADKTGYPADMLESNMDMEADLGIDSIKRVEILGAVQDELPDLPELNPDDLAELRTLGQIIDYMKSSSPAGVIASAVPIAQEVAINTVEQVEVATANIEQLKPVMLEVVAEKTGYPAEMLELDMDMEADLGIDSIKRVEILGAVQDAFPELPEINPDVLAELRTLREIIDTMSHTAGFASPKAQQAVETIVPTPKQVATADQAPSSTVAIKSLNAPDILDVNVPETAIALITDEGSELTTRVVEGLSAKGWQTVVMRFPSNIVAKQAALPSGAKVLDLADMTEVALQSALESITENIGNVDTLIHLQPELLNPADKITYSSESKAILQIVFLLAKHLKVSLNDAAETDMRAAFITVPRLDGCLGYGAKNDADLVQGGLFGLTKTVNQEWPDVFCRAVDISPDLAADKAANYILSEMNDADTSLAEVGYSDQGRVTLVVAPTNSYELAQGQSITSDSVFLVSGGAKGVTTKCAAAVAERYRCKFVLLGRSGFSDVEPEWAQGCNDEAELKKRAMQQLIDSGDKPTPVKIQQFIKPILSNREIAAALNSIRQLGAQAEYVSADVTDVQGMKAKVQPAVNRLGEITGIIHGAGVLADKFIEQKTVADFDSVYTTKIDGMTAMLSCVDASSLQQLMLFSSAAGFYGNTGQADYSVANDILNKTALRFKQQQSHCQVVSFNWGPWDGGMVTPELKRMFKERNVYVIPLEAGAQLFVNEMAAADNRCPQILVGNDMAGGEAPEAGGASVVKKPQASRLSRVIKAASNPFIQDHVIGGNPVVPTVCATGWMASSCENLFPGYKFCGFDNYKLYKGIIFDGNEADTYFMELTPTSVNDTQLHCNAVIGSKNAKGLPRKHYEADIVLQPIVPDAPLYQDVDLSDQQVQTGPQLYQDGTLFHGARFQGIDALLNVNQQKMTLKCLATEVSIQDQGQFPIGTGNIYTDDLMYQAMLVWARHEYDSGSLPSCAKSFEQYTVIQPGQTFYLSLDVVSHSASNLTADITLHDEAGRIYSRMKSGEVTISKSLGKLFEK